VPLNTNRACAVATKQEMSAMIIMMILFSMGY